MANKVILLNAKKNEQSFTFIVQTLRMLCGACHVGEKNMLAIIDETSTNDFMQTLFGSRVNKMLQYNVFIRNSDFSYDISYEINFDDIFTTST